MIRIQKPKGAAPESLWYPIPNLAKSLTQKARTTHERRQDVIDANGYPEKDNKFNSRYKQEDTKTALENFYNHKCCYCEQRIESYHVEHYRPKSLYWWLAYSWDNLLFICPACNTAKLDKFEISNSKANYLPTDLPNIHSLRDVYNLTENPSLLNPECDYLDEMWVFNTKGEISSEHHRGKYTIETCKLDRDSLNDERKKIFDNFNARIKAAEADYLLCYPHDRKRFDDTIQNEINFFVLDALNDTETYLAFRRYILDFMKDVVNDILS